MKKYDPIYWQQIPSTITFLMGVLLILAGIFGTWALSQYRLGKVEENQVEFNKKLDELDKSVIVIATKLGVPVKELQSSNKPNIISPFSQEPSEQTVTFTMQENGPSIQPKPTPIPPPTPTSTLEKVIDAVKEILP